MNHLFLIFFCTALHFAYGQIRPDSIQIVRDRWGVPHIFAPTDEEVAYGLAWANAEDDFASIQEPILSGMSKLAIVKGKSAAPRDVIAHLIGLKELVDTAYHARTFSPKYQKIVEAYVAGLNAYAKKYPQEVLLKGTFPVTPKDLLRGHTLGLAFFTGVHEELTKILNGSIDLEQAQVQSFGSNAIAVSRRKTLDGKTYLAINSHQPLEGPYSWYEAHLCSNEGWNMLGGLLHGFPAIGHGVNENLAWAHTVNRPDFTDVYRLEINPQNPLQYKFDGKWETLMERPMKLRVKVGPLRLRKKLKFYWSHYGATVKTKKGCYALRFASNMGLKAAEQQYWMNKARNFEEFKKALQLQGYTCFNLVYADKADNIYYLSNALLPYRNAGYDWKKVLPGNTSQTLWPALFHPLSDLPQLSNPSSGYVFNTNNQPYNATAAPNNLKPAQFDATMGFETFDNNRSLRLGELMEKTDKLGYDDFKKIKYDLQYPKKTYYLYAENIEEVFALDPTKYPDIKNLILMLKNWDKVNNKESKAASVYLLFLKNTLKKLKATFRDRPGNRLSEIEMVEALRSAQKHLLKHFKSTEIPLGEMQRHIRGKKNLPIQGAYDVLAAMYSDNYKNGRFKTIQGESYIAMIRFNSDGVEIETVNAYGASNKKGSKHFNDQMELFVNRELKPMTLDKSQVFREAVRVYAPK